MRKAEEIYKEEMLKEIPDLWDHIEQNLTPKKKTIPMHRWALLVAAIVVIVILIPVIPVVMHQNQKEATPMEGIDMAADGFDGMAAAEGAEAAGQEAEDQALYLQEEEKKEFEIDILVISLEEIDGELEIYGEILSQDTHQFHKRERYYFRYQDANEDYLFSGAMRVKVIDNYENVYISEVLEYLEILP